MNAPILLANGTRVVLIIDAPATKAQPPFSKGSTGMIVKVPIDGFHNYRVRFPDGGIGTFARTEICVLHDYKVGEALPDLLEDMDLADSVIYRCVTGSRAYGLDHEGSDIDRRGIYLPAARAHWSLYGVPEQLENKDEDEVYWELQKFIMLALKANPNILEVLNTPIIEHITPLAQELRDRRHMFLSKLAYQTFNGYVLSQFKKMNRRKEKTGEMNLKHGMHLIRLLLSGIHLLQEGDIQVRVEAHRDELLAIRRGERTWEEVEKWRVALHGKFDAAFSRTSLPERPDYREANAFLIRARRSAVEDTRE